MRSGAERQRQEQPVVSIGIVSSSNDGNGSGRIHYYEDTGEVGIHFINPDRYSAQIRESHPEFTQEQADSIAASLAEAHRHALAEARSDFGFETVGSHESKPVFLRELKNKGYFVVVIFMGTESPEINKRRIAERVKGGGHDVSPEKVTSRYYRTMRLLRDYFDIADYIAIYDNSLDNEGGGDAGPRLLVTKDAAGDAHVTEHCRTVQWIHEYLLDLP